jgi:SNF2 family DNA or RNA helicase
MKLSSQCSICGKNLILASESQFGDSTLRNYKCGHSFFEKNEVPGIGIPVPTWDEKHRRNYASLPGTKNAFDFQQEGIEFINRTNFNCILGDPMGLGKTIQILIAAREARFPDGQPRFKTILTIVKAATTYQWFGESKEWFADDSFSAYIIQGTNGWVPPGFRMYIISMDTLSRFMKTPKGQKTMKDLNIDLVIVDECHSFKNPDSARSQALVNFLQDISTSEISRTLKLGCAVCGHEWTKDIKLKVNCRTNKGTISDYQSGTCEKCNARFGHATQHELKPEERTKGLVMLSGTLIKNRADEYFIPLNLLKPETFTNNASFRRNWLSPDPVTGKWNRISRWRLEEFRKITDKFIIRREKTEVLQDLPPFRRVFEKVSIEDSKFKENYNAALDMIQRRMDELAVQGREMGTMELRDNLMILRHICGVAKVQAGVEHVEEFLESTETEKIAVGVHHQSVRDNLYLELKQRDIRVLKLSGEDSAERKNEILEEFRTNPEIRVLVINMLAGGVGLNIQSANNILTLERQWNAADEEQFEGRFWRQGQTLPVQNTYLIAEGIEVEVFFTQMVEKKRAICGESLDGWDIGSDRIALQEIMDRSLMRKLK